MKADVAADTSIVGKFILTPFVNSARNCKSIHACRLSQRGGQKRGLVPPERAHWLGGRVEVDEIVRSHAIEPATLRAGDFDAYFRCRRGALVGLVERAIGKQVLRNWDDGHMQALEEPDSVRARA